MTGYCKDIRRAVKMDGGGNRSCQVSGKGFL
jgi:hypothetical protein